MPCANRLWWMNIGARFVHTIQLVIFVTLMSYRTLPEMARVAEITQQVTEDGKLSNRSITNASTPTMAVLVWLVLTPMIVT